MSNDDKTIIIITPAFPANESETYWVPSQQLLVKALKRNFPQLIIIVISYSYPYKKASYSWNGIKIVSLDGMHRRKLKRPFLLLDMWNILKKIKNESNVIGLFSFWCREGALIGKWFGKWHKLKHFCWICGQDARKTNKYVKWIAPKSHEIVAISDFIREEFYKNHHVRPAEIIPNAIDPDSFPPVLSQERDIDLLAVGSLIPLKQFDVFISVVKILKPYLPGIKAIICGAGEEKENLETHIVKYKLENHIRLLDAMPQNDVLKLMQRTKVFLHPSAYEGFSTVCLEAIYAGAHVISFTKPMDHEIKNWHVVDTKEEMAEKGLVLLQNNNLTHERVLAYDMNDSAKKLMTLFDQTRS